MGKRGPKRDASRELDMVERYKGGQTLQEIGDHYGLSRERVRQLLKRHGVTRKDSVRISTAKKPKVVSNEAKERRCVEKWGISREKWKYLRSFHADIDKTPIGAFTNQRNGAKRRGIEWRMTLAEWWELWEESGKYAERGREHGQYCMARRMDDGPYEKANVSIQTVTENHHTRNYCKSAKRCGHGKNSVVSMYWYDLA